MMCNENAIPLAPGGVRFTSPGNRHLGLNYIGIETSGWCNRSCKFCPANKWPETSHKGSYISSAVFEHIIQELETWGIGGYKGEIALYGNNEPLLDKKLCERYRELNSRIPKANLSLATNADLLTTDKALDIFRSGVTTLLCNCYDVTGATLEKVSLIAAQLSTRESIAVIKNPQKGFHPINHNEVGRVMIIHDARDAGLNYPGATGRAGNVPGAVPIDSPLKLNCSRPWTHVHLQWDGNMLICCQDWRNNFVVGNVMNSSIRELYNSEKMEDVRRRLFMKDRAGILCEKCEWGTSD